MLGPSARKTGQYLQARGISFYNRESLFAAARCIAVRLIRAAVHQWG
jgi:hypothetical protein